MNIFAFVYLLLHGMFENKSTLLHHA